MDITKSSAHDSFVDLRADESNSLSMRFTDQSSSIISNMLKLSNDHSLTGTGFGAIINSRMNASSYYIGTVDTRSPSQPGVYSYMDQHHTSQFAINKGSGTGGFSFSTYGEHGTLLSTHLNLLSNGVVQMPYYQLSGNALDTEQVSLLGWDEHGNLVRNYNGNYRFRNTESRMSYFEQNVNGPITTKVNKIVDRLNGLVLFSQLVTPISQLLPSPQPQYSPSPQPQYSPSPQPNPNIPFITGNFAVLYAGDQSNTIIDVGRYVQLV